MYKIVLEKVVLKFLEKHKGEKLITILKEKLFMLSENPFRQDLDITALIGEKNKYRLRIGKYRFLYEINDEVITIIVFNADSRGSIYK